MPEAVSYDRFTPDYLPSKYSSRDALSFCLASHLAYAKADGRNDEGTISTVTEGWGFREVEAFELVRGSDIDTQGFVAVGERHILAAFRGTESLPDWLTNLQTVTDSGPWGDTKVHEGFQDAFHAAALHIGEVIGRRRRKRHQVWLTGHSLGGALAVVLAATLIESGIPVRGLYTFGAPRVGDRRFAELLNDALKGRAHWRVANEGDLVPHVPPELFFSHAGNRMLLRKDEGPTPSKRTWRRFRKDIWGWIGTVVDDAFDEVTDLLKITDPHRLDSEGGYLNRLAAALDDKAT